MRTTINLDDELLKQAKLAAQRSGTTLTALIEDAVRERLARQTSAPATEPVRLPTVGGRGPRPGVDLDDSTGLRELLDAPA